MWCGTHISLPIPTLYILQWLMRFESDLVLARSISKQGTMCSIVI